MTTTTSTTPKTLIYPHGDYDSSCNYCKSGGDKGRISFGMVSETMTVQHYQQLIDHGWRRSGTFIYKPKNEDANTCCPQYTIRLDVTTFKPSKDNKATIKKFNNFIQNDIIHSSTPGKDETKTTSTATTSTIPNEHQDEINSFNQFIFEILSSSFTNFDKFSPGEKKIVQDNLKLKVNPKKIVKEIGNYSLSFSIFNKFKSTILNQLSITIDQIIDLVLQNYNSVQNNNITNQFKLEKGLNNHINVFTTTTTITTPHTSTPVQHTTTTTTTTLPTTPNNNQPKHKLEISIHKPQCTNEIFNLYCKYQKLVHKETDEKTKSAFKRFLVDSPLIPLIHKDVEYDDYVYDGIDKDDQEADSEDEEDESEEDDEKDDSKIKNKIYKIGIKANKSTIDGLVIPKPGYGTFHQHYRIDGKLVGVGVIDILPSCLSSVYFFYDPDYNYLNLGKYSALNEIDWVKDQVSSGIENLKYYYMGYYILNCQKMAYKGSYQPSELLCLETFKWVNFKTAISLLKDKRYCRFYFDDSTTTTSSTTTTATDSKKLSYFEKDPTLIEQVVFKQGSYFFHYSDVSPRFQNIIRQTVIDYINRVGPDMIKEFIFYFK